MSQIAVYFQSWSSTWVSVSASMDLALIDNRVTIVNIAFAQPNCTYVTGQKTFVGTGLNFSQDFGVVAGAIFILKNRGVKVMLSVGGSTYPFDTYNSDNIAQLCWDLGCNGVDIDWEPSNGVASSGLLGAIISKTTGSLQANHYVSIAGWSTGALPPNGDTYQGMNISGIQNTGHQLSWINIMAYDAGTTYDPIGAYAAYRNIYKGPLNLGFEVGTQSWGGYVLDNSDLTKSLNYVYADGSQNGIFIWSYQKQPAGTTDPTVTNIISAAVGIFHSATPTTGVQVAVPVGVSTVSNYEFNCPNCNTLLSISLSK